MSDRISLRAEPAPNQSRTGPDGAENMTPTDVLRGVWRAYLWGLAFFAVIGLPAILHPLYYMLFVGMGGLVGLVLTFPAAFVALSIYYGLRETSGSIHWSFAPIACTVILSVVFWALAGEPLGAVWALILGPFFGYAFWDGAVGHTATARLRVGDPA